MLHIPVDIHLSGWRLEPIMSGLCSGWLTEVGGRHQWIRWFEADE